MRLFVVIITSRQSGEILNVRWYTTDDPLKARAEGTPSWFQDPLHRLFVLERP